MKRLVLLPVYLSQEEGYVKGIAWAELLGKICAEVYVMMAKKTRFTLSKLLNHQVWTNMHIQM